MDPREEQLYDEYVERAVRGQAEDPASFLDRADFHSPGLLDALRAVYEHASNPPAAPPRHDAADTSTDDPHSPDPPAADPAAPARERRLGDFRLIRKLGEGGMGVVWLAEQISLGRRVALKLIRGEAAQSHVAAERFEREARAAAKLHHPNIVAVYAVGEAKGTRYIAMELVEGRGLDELLADATRAGEAMPTAEAIRIAAAVALALHYAHAQGVVHRDVKPSNILVTPDGRPMLLDFGLARDLDAAVATLTEAFVGSPAYAAPEQVGRRGGHVDPRTDVYSLGVVLYEMLTGRVPVASGTLEQMLHSILTDEPPPPRMLNARVSRDLQTVVLKALEKDPARRYASAAAFAEDLNNILAFRTIAARPPGPVARLAKWSARNRGLAVGLVTGVAGLVLAAGVYSGQRLAASRARAAEAERTLHEAERLVRSYAADLDAGKDAERVFDALAGERQTRYFTPEQDRAVDHAEDRVAAARMTRELAFYQALELASRAERLGADPDRVKAVRAGLYLRRYFEADQTGNAVERAMYRDLVLGHDSTDGAFATKLRGRTSLIVRTTPPNAEVFLFRRELASELWPGAEPRRVLVPWRDDQTPTHRADAWGLRVVRGVGPVRTGDVVLAVDGLPVRGCVVVERSGDPRVPVRSRLVNINDDEVTDADDAVDLGRRPPDGRVLRLTFARAGGLFEIEAESLAALGVEVIDARGLAERGGVQADVWSEGVVTSVALPPGLRVRLSAAPTLLGPRAALGTTPAQYTGLESGSYLLVARAPGHELCRLPITLTHDQAREIDLTLFPDGTTPEGWVRLPPVPGAAPGELAWIMEREVTVRDYFEFLNDPATLAEVLASPTPIRYPRDGETARGQRDEQGRFTLPTGWDWEWPVLFVSHHDARAYAAWRTARAHAAGGRETYDLPSLDEWLVAASAARGDVLVFGPRFRPKWVSSCYARPTPDPHPVMSFPVDESVLGVYDMAGSASEWSRTPWRTDQNYARYCGGAWGTGRPTDFYVHFGNGTIPETVGGMIGFRLVRRLDAAEDTP